MGTVGKAVSYTHLDVYKRQALMDVFRVVKDNVTARQMAEYYGIKIGRNGMACCPFHDRCV